MFHEINKHAGNRQYHEFGKVVFQKYFRITDHEYAPNDTGEKFLFIRKIKYMAIYARKCQSKNYMLQLQYCSKQSDAGVCSMVISSMVVWHIWNISCVLLFSRLLTCYRSTMLRQ